MTTLTEAVSAVGTDLAQGFTPVVVTQPDPDVVTALCTEFDPVGILDLSNFGDRSDLIETLIEGITYSGGHSNIILIEHVELADADMATMLRHLPTSRAMRHHRRGNFQLPENTQFIFVSHGREEGLAQSEVPLFERFGIILHEVIPDPEPGDTEIAQELTNLHDHLVKLIATEREVGNTAEAERFERMRQALVLATDEQHTH